MNIPLQNKATLFIFWIEDFLELSHSEQKHHPFMVIFVEQTMHLSSTTTISTTTVANRLILCVSRHQVSFDKQDTNKENNDLKGKKWQSVAMGLAR